MRSVVSTKLVRFEMLIDAGGLGSTPEWNRVRRDLETAIRHVDWPPGSGSFTIYDQPGKKRGEGSGVGPIKRLFLKRLSDLGWTLETKLQPKGEKGPGPLDASLALPSGLFAVEWETGNISSSHRAVNKIALHLLEETLSGGILVLPTRELYHYLTDRVGNWNELVPYLPLWRSLSVARGVLAIVAVEHDAVSKTVPRFPKATNGRALG